MRRPLGKAVEADDERGWLGRVIAGWHVEQVRPYCAPSGRCGDRCSRHAAPSPAGSRLLGVPRPRPARQYASDLAFDLRPRVPSVIPLRKELVVVRLGVAHVGDDRQSHGLGIQFPGRRGSADPAAVFVAGVFGDHPLAAWRASVIQVAHSRGEARDVLLIFFRPPFGLTLPAPSPRIGIG